MCAGERWGDLSSIQTGFGQEDRSVTCEVSSHSHTRMHTRGATFRLLVCTVDKCLRFVCVILVTEDNVPR